MRAAGSRDATSARVVVVEGATPGKAILDPILRARGIGVVGHAGAADDLESVLGSTDPNVIVFDAETTAETVATARSLAPRAGLVVVWPPDVAALDAEEHVDPDFVVTDLAAAVVAVNARHPRGTSPPIAAPTRLDRAIPGIAGTTVHRQSRRQALLAVASILAIALVLFLAWPALQRVIDLRSLFPSLPDAEIDAGALFRSAPPITVVARSATTGSVSQISAAAPVLPARSHAVPSDQHGPDAKSASGGRTSHGGGGGADGGPRPGTPSNPNPPNSGGHSPGNSGNAPGHNPDPPGNAPDPGGSPGNSGNAPGHNKDDGGSPGNSAAAPGHNKDSGAPGNSGNAPGHNKD